MADIRTPNWPAAGNSGNALVPQKGTGSQRAEAQRAFFQAALTGQAVTAPQTAAPAAPTQATATSQDAPRGRRPDLTIEVPKDEPQKILRPGSIIDIWV
ncbi:hypothetical protein ACO2Q3_17915 [Caulobacter sp. KR2-114]|uniref:hypothetical protein n=1 Tax=Caulobacter sp. KR2-114 TaxID=3400912 RepID=UPI003C0D0EB9